MQAENGIRIRAAVKDDLRELCSARNTEALYESYFSECDGTIAHFLVAEIDQRIAGFGLVYLGITNTGKKKSLLPKISDLFVAEEFRRQRVATILMTACETLAKQYGFSTINVSVDPTESAGMLVLATQRAYEPLQDKPYAVAATFYDTKGHCYNKQYFRLDFSKRLV